MKAKEMLETMIESRILGKGYFQKVNEDDYTRLITPEYILSLFDLLAKQEGHKLVPLEPSEERQKAFAKVWFKSGWAHWSTNLPVDKERFNAAYKAMIGVSDE